MRGANINIPRINQADESNRVQGTRKTRTIQRY